MDGTPRRLAAAAVTLAATALLSGCGGGVSGTSAELVHRASERTFSAGSARFEQSAPGVSRTGDVELGQGRGRIVEHGRFGYREYRYLDGAWFQLGGEIGDIGEDLGGKFVRHPRAGAKDDVLAAIEGHIRALTRARQVRKLEGRTFSATVDGARETLRLDAHGRLVELHRGRLLLAFSHFGESVEVDEPTGDELFVGHD